MKTVLLGLAVLWGASVAAVGLGILCMWLFDRTRAEPEQTAPRIGPEAIAARAHLRVLEPDPELLVPWNAVRSSKQRMGVREVSRPLKRRLRPVGRPRRSP